MINYISKHDPTAYVGKMDRLTFSRQISWLEEFCFDAEQSVYDEVGMQLENLRIAGYNQAMIDVRNELKRTMEQVYKDDDESLDLYWNISQEELTRAREDYKKGLGL